MYTHNQRINMKKIVVNFLIILTANSIGQFILDKISKLMLMLQGYGSGSFPSESGEEKVFQILLEKRKGLHEPIIIFDVGANEGQYLQLVLDHITNKDFLIYSFEPAFASFEGLSRKFHDMKNIKLENVGLDNFDHRSKIYYESPKSLRASKFQRDLRHLGVEFSNSEEVDFITLDHYCASKVIDKIDLLKIDVEGNEFNVLKGAEVLLSHNAIRLITFEFGRAHVDSRTYFKDIYYFLKDHKMKILYRIFPNGYLKRIEAYDEKHEVFFPTNYLAIMR